MWTTVEQTFQNKLEGHIWNGTPHFVQMETVPFHIVVAGSSQRAQMQWASLRTALSSEHAQSDTHVKQT